MVEVRIVGKKGSKACKAISTGADIPMFKRAGRGDVIVNYGLTGQKLDFFLRKSAAARTIPMLNKYVGCAKDTAVIAAEKAGILVPETRPTLPAGAKLSDWIEKRVNSSQGKGICAARGRGRIPGKYYQRMIKHRKFELRVHAFRWVPQDQWRLNKRLGPADQIAWNFHQGGHFVGVRRPNDFKVFKEAKDIALKILEMRNMAFGAVDLIVDEDNKVYFIEVNSSPGFEELNRQCYIDAFLALKKLTKKEALKYCNR